jgi:hypothetical protein
LQTQNDSPLLKQPPSDFNKRVPGGGVTRVSRNLNGMNLDTVQGSSEMEAKSTGPTLLGENVAGDEQRGDSSDNDKPQVIGENSPDNGDEEAQNSRHIGTAEEEAWKDLQIQFPDPISEQAVGLHRENFLQQWKLLQIPTSLVEQ